MVGGWGARKKVEQGGEVGKNREEKEKIKRLSGKKRKPERK